MALETATNQNPSKPAGQKSKTKDPAPTAASSESVDVAAPAIPALGDDVAGKPSSADGSHESSYIRELQKHIRNVTKKLAAMQKVDAVIAENPGKSLDDLVTTRKINNDQKAQALKKPALKAQLAQFEEQIAQYKKFEEEYQIQASKEKEQFHAAHQEELRTVRATAKAEAVAEAERSTRQKLLTLSRFLRAAASRRQLEDDTSEESKAFEGLLLLLYGGDNAAVDAAEKLINGSDEGVLSTEELPLSVSYAKIKEISEAYAPFAAEEAWRQEVAEAEQNHLVDAPTGPISSLGTDPTIAHAGLTEMNDDATGLASAVPGSREPRDVDIGAANEAAASNWDAARSAAQDPLADSWVSVSAAPDAVEPETLVTGMTKDRTQSWADDAPDASDAAAAAAAGDGFHEVHHNRNTARARGGAGHERGGRGRGDFRGRGGFRGERGGEFRGRGRGGRGGRGAAA